MSEAEAENVSNALDTERWQGLIEAGIVVPAAQEQRQLRRQRVEMAPGPSVAKPTNEQRR